MNNYNIIKAPIVSEKSNMQKELANQLTFEVDKKANRIEIKKAVQNLFNVKVDSVRTMQIKGKYKQRGRIIGKRRDWKKAVVKLKPGERIEIFEGI
jgi:large subunit ribosomal protein L23